MEPISIAMVIGVFIVGLMSGIFGSGIGMCFGTTPKGIITGILVSVFMTTFIWVQDPKGFSVPPLHLWGSSTLVSIVIFFGYMAFMYFHEVHRRNQEVLTQIVKDLN